MARPPSNQIFVKVSQRSQRPRPPHILPGPPGTRVGSIWPGVAGRPAPTARHQDATISRVLDATAESRQVFARASARIGKKNPMLPRHQTCMDERSSS